MIPGPRHIERIFDGVPDACVEARSFVSSSLADVVGSDRLYDVKVATSELTTNAIKYAAGGKITVEIDITNQHAMVHIVDSGGPTIPQVKHEVADDSEGGRGLLLVEALTDATGIVEAATCGCHDSARGWCCWFRIDLPTPSTVIGGGEVVA